MSTKWTIYKKVFFGIILIVIFAGCNSQKVSYPDELNQLQENLISYYLNTPVDDVKVEGLLDKMESNGSWPNIDYANYRRGGWPVKEHLENVQTLAIAYKMEGSEYYQKSQVSKKIHLSLNYWLDNDFLSPNWWDQHIGVPELLAPTIFLMEEELTAEQINQALVLMRRAEIKMTGQNKVWLSGNVLFRSLLVRDADSITMASNSIQEELSVTEGEGIQFDWSYHQHGSQLQFGNYGLSYLEDMLRWYQILNKTPFTFDDNKADILRNYILNGQQWINWKNKFDVSVCGRQIFPDEPVKKAKRLDAIIQTMAVIDEAYAGDYEKALDYKTLNGNKHFWKSDFQVHRTKDYYFSVKMCSNRVLGAETVNKENIQGYHMGDGVTFLYQSGNEYDNVFPFWDWKKLPGTTLIQHKDTLPYLTAWGYHIESDFVGGVSDSINGIAVLDYNRDGLKAHKSWFMFNDKIVCLGSGIQASSKFPVATAVNQVFLGEDILINKNNETRKTRKLNGQINADWVLHDNIGYIFPKGAKLNLQTKMLEGSWNKVAKKYRPIILTNETFKLWFDHGANPKNESYAYVIVPNASEEQMNSLNEKMPFNIINKENLQTVESTDKKIAGAVFYTPGKANILDGIEVDAPCIIMTKKLNNKILLSLADPTHKLQSISVTLNGNYATEWGTQKGGQTILNIPLPQNEYAGKTITISLKPI